jgi:hypothetical protein
MTASCSMVRADKRPIKNLSHCERGFTREAIHIHLSNSWLFQNRAITLKNTNRRYTLVVDLP